MLTTEMKLPPLAEKELLEEGLDTFDKVTAYHLANGTFEGISGIGPVTNKSIIDKIIEIESTLPPTEVPTEDAAVESEPAAEDPVHVVEEPTVVEEQAENVEEPVVPEPGVVEDPLPADPVVEEPTVVEDAPAAEPTPVVEEPVPAPEPEAIEEPSFPVQPEAPAPEPVVEESVSDPAPVEVAPEEREGGQEIEEEVVATPVLSDESDALEDATEAKKQKSDLVIVKLIHRTGSTSVCPKPMGLEDVEKFWRMNRRSWRSYEILDLKD